MPVKLNSITVEKAIIATRIFVPLNRHGCPNINFFLNKFCKKVLNQTGKSILRQSLDTSNSKNVFSVPLK